MAEFFEVGDNVVLNSGGPVMVVEEIQDKIVYCAWITSKGERQTAYFKRPMISLLVREETD